MNKEHETELRLLKLEIEIRQLRDRVAEFGTYMYDPENVSNTLNSTMAYILYNEDSKN